MFKAEIFRQCRSTALQKIAVSPFAYRYSPFAAVLPFATRYSLFAVVFGSAGASPSRLIPSCVLLPDELDGD